MAGYGVLADGGATALRRLMILPCRLVSAFE
jgi:hypothetical protein